MAGDPHLPRTTAVLDVRGLSWASEQNVVAAVLGRRPGVLGMEVNAVAQTATVTFDPTRTTLAQLRDWVRACGYHCAGRSVPAHICDPMQMPPDHTTSATGQPAPPGAPAGRDGHHTAHEPPGEAPPQGAPSPHEMMGHGGHAGTSMAAMVADMRNRFLVAALFSIPILIWSPIGHDVFRLDVAVPFGLRQDVWALLLSLPVIFYSSWIFFDGTVRALRARTLDMMVLVAVAIGSGWLYSLYVTATGGGDVFYEAATVLAAFVLLGHWFEMRARGGTQRRDPDPAGPGPADGGGDPRRRTGGDPDRRGEGRRPAAGPPGREDRRGRGGRGRRVRGRRVDGHRGEPAGAQATG